MSTDSVSQVVTPAATQPIPVPYPVTNEVTNPSFETGTSPWTAVTATLATSTSSHTSGTHCLEITPTSNSFSATYTSAQDIANATTHCVAVDVLGITDTGGIGYVEVTVFLYDVDTITEVTVNSPRVTAADLPYHYPAPLITAGTNGPYQLEVVVSGNEFTPDAADRVRVDSVIWTKTAGPVAYFDGDSAGCVWNGTAHASTSTKN